MQFSELVQRRYSVRKFEGRPIEQDKMDMILQAGRLAPTGCNYQPQRILVLKGEQVEGLRGITPFLYGQDAALVICYDTRESWKHRSGRDIGEVDATIVMTQMLYQAQALGIGSLIVGMYKEELLREKYAIPSHYQVVAMLMLGYPAPDCQPHPTLHGERKPLEETVVSGSFET